MSKVSEALARAAMAWCPRDILCLGNGPSLGAVDFSLVNIPTMGINKSCRIHISEFHTMHDHPANWRAYTEAAPQSREILNIGSLPNERRLQRSQILFLFDPCNRSTERWICERLGIEYMSHSSGEYALIACAFLGFRRVWLIGYDSNDGEGHAKALIKDEERDYCIDRERMGHARHFEQVAKVMDRLAIQVINCNPESAIKCWNFA